MSEDNQFKLLYSEQAVRMLGANVRAALESQLTPEKVSQVFQEASERLEERLARISQTP